MEQPDAEEEEAVAAALAEQEPAQLEAPRARPERVSAVAQPCRRSWTAPERGACRACRPSRAPTRG